MENMMSDIHIGYTQWSMPTAPGQHQVWDDVPSGTQAASLTIQSGNRKVPVSLRAVKGA